jgi:hypothetical protein
MHNTKKENTEFNITFCETNLRWLSGNPESPENTKKIEKTKKEISRLKKILKTL